MTRARVTVWLVLLLGACGSTERPPAGEPKMDELQRFRRSLQLALADPADLRPEARRILERYAAGLEPTVPRLLLDPAFSDPPATIKVWRRSLGGSESCSGKVDTFPMEDYVKGVLPHEWISSWPDESLKAGSVAIRTYASYWVAAGGKYDCADLCDTTYSQVYKDDTLPVTNQAIDATKGELLIKDDKLVFAEYSAENGDPTKTGVSDPVCAGKALYGHGRGMCQWGSSRWAGQGKDYQWIALHYYPGATLWSPTPPTPDQGPAPDLAPAAIPDLPATPRLEGGAARADAGPGPLAIGGQLTGTCHLGSAASAADPRALLLPLLLLGLFLGRRARGR